MTGFSAHNTGAVEMQQTKERFFAFIDRLEEKLKEFTEAAVPELAALGNSDTDTFKSAYYRMKAAVLGQVDSICKKATDTQEEKITNFCRTRGNHEADTAYYDFRQACYEKTRQLEDLCSQCRGRIESTYTEDYEAAYREIQEEYDIIKDAFRCLQCGSPIVIDQIYFTTTYITCPACHTKNTFSPGSKAKNLEHVGRGLAEQRTKYLLQEHDKAVADARELFQQVHRLKIDLSFSKNGGKEQLARLEQRWQEAEKQSDLLYQKYLRAMFDEWNSINPALSGQHEGFYKRLWDEYRERNKTGSPES